MNELTQSRLKELLNYDPDTGHFTWLVKYCKKVKVGGIAGTINNLGYIQITINKKRYLAHRLAFLYMAGKFPEDGLQVDHINHVTGDNRWVNLRLVTRQGNQKNRSINKNNKCGCTGVSRYKATNKYIAQIWVDGNRKHLGYFVNYKEAVKARKEAELKYKFHKNHGK